MTTRSHSITVCTSPRGIVVVVVVKVEVVTVVNDAVELVVELVEDVVVVVVDVEVVTRPLGVRISTSNSDTSTLLAVKPSSLALKSIYSVASRSNGSQSLVRFSHVLTWVLTKSTGTAT